MFYIYFFLGAHRFFLQINTLILIKGLDAFPFKLHLNFDLKSYQKSFQKNNVTVSSSTCYREGGPPADHKDRKLLKWRGRQGLAQHWAVCGWNKNIFVIFFCHHNCYRFNLILESQTKSRLFEHCSNQAATCSPRFSVFWYTIMNDIVKSNIFMFVNITHTYLQPNQFSFSSF